MLSGEFHRGHTDTWGFADLSSASGVSHSPGKVAALVLRIRVYQQSMLLQPFGSSDSADPAAGSLNAKLSCGMQDDDFSTCRNIRSAALEGSNTLPVSLAVHIALLQSAETTPAAMGLDSVTSTQHVQLRMQAQASKIVLSNSDALGPHLQYICLQPRACDHRTHSPIQTL